MFDNQDEDHHAFDDIKGMPIFKKAEIIRELTQKIVDIISREESNAQNDYEAKMLDQYAEYLFTNSSIIPAKIAGAESGDIYDLRMENAAIIRKSAREIITDCRGLEIAGFKEVDYLNLIRNEIEEFRILFTEWVKTFDQGNYIIDRWGLFNPPGVNYDDQDPDDDIPFDPEDFFNDLD
ncbi:hypothetical protein [uncultured Aquimarina sp.]|uniref:hypothetical protein n=1 Tax=uncultured Aquimarina sp. TaxID=575652 RepID=UPI00261B5003|nr:hypothetical protein [uncultured Aquimarina sp.]